MSDRSIAATQSGVPSGAEPDTSIIIVSYNVRALLDRCLRSLAGEGQTDVIVVDNASSDGTPAYLRQNFPDVRLIANQTNAGFGVANNQGLALARGEWVLFLNPDAELRPGALAALRRILETQPGVGVVGPRLRYADGQIQSSRRRFPTPLMALAESTVLGRWWPTNPAARRYHCLDVSDGQAQDVDWLNGACLLTRRSVLEQIGGFDPRFFMYSEELDWCRRVRDGGWRIVYSPSAEVIHREGKSSEQNLARRARNFHESKARYFEKYYGRGVGRALRIYLLANTLYDLGAEALKFTLGHKVAIRRQRVRAHWAVACDQLRRLLAGGSIR